MSTTIMQLGTVKRKVIIEAYSQGAIKGVSLEGKPDSVRFPGDDQVKSHILFDRIRWHTKVAIYSMGVKSKQETH
jgi:hypothetical protein